MYMHVTSLYPESSSFHAPFRWPGAHEVPGLAGSQELYSALSLSWSRTVPALPGALPTCSRKAPGQEGTGRQALTLS